MDIRYVGEVEDMNYSKRECIQNPKEKEGISAESKEDWRSAWSCFLCVCLEKNVSVTKIWTFLEMILKSLDGNIFFLYTESMKILLTYT